MITIKGLNFVNGKLHDHPNAFVKTNPCTEEEFGNFPLGDGGVVDEAVACAKKAFGGWRSLSRIQRSLYFETMCDLLKKHKDNIAEAISFDTGKSLNESHAEVIESLHMVQYCLGVARMPDGQCVSSEIADKDCYVLRKPKGVVAVVSPFNFPCAISGFWTCAPAILEGNTVVLKPSEDAPYTGQIVAELYKDCNFPEGVFNLVHGDGTTGDILCQHKDVNHICFTGSATVGRHIRRICADSWRKTCSCEMGSKSAVIVFDDADYEMALNACVASAYKLSGQRCVSAGRLLIQRGIFDKFANDFAEMSSNIKIGDPFETPDIFMGPVINEQQLNKIMAFNEEAAACPKTDVMMMGGRMRRKGYFLSPFVYKTEWEKEENRRFLKEEVFGPSIALIPFDDADDAIRIYNDTDYGLAMGVITNDFKKMRLMRDLCDYGLGYVNLPCIGAESHLPFGGHKKSGYGGASAAGTFDCVTQKSTWTVNHQDKGFQMAQGLKV